MFDFLSDLIPLTEKPSRRYRWINWIVWGLAIVAILISVAYYGLLASNYLTGWPAS